MVAHLSSISDTQIPRMKVRFLEAVCGPDVNIGTGVEIDLPRSDALYWIRVGLAEKVEPVQKKVTVQKVRKASTR